MALFPVTSNIQVGGRPPSWIISNGHISATAHSIHLYSAHRAVIFAIAQLSCTNNVLNKFNVCWNNIYRIVFGMHKWQSVKGIQWFCVRLDCIYVYTIKVEVLESSLLFS